MSFSIIGFLYKYLGIMDARDTESNVHYSLDSYRDLEDFWEAAIRKTGDPDLRVDHYVAAELIHCVSLKSQVCVYIKFHIK